MILSERYIVAAIGNGFRVYDIVSGACVIDCKEAHEATVLHLVSLYKGTCIATCSADSSIKLWSASPKTLEKNNVSRSTQRFKKPTPDKPVCLGEMWGHSDAVNGLVTFSHNSFASCGADGQVIVWKDGSVQAELRNQYATASLLHYRLLYVDRVLSQDTEEEGFDEDSMDGGEGFHTPISQSPPRISPTLIRSSSSPPPLIRRNSLHLLMQASGSYKSQAPMQTGTLSPASTDHAPVEDPKGHQP